jgi:hypothetical protein
MTFLRRIPNMASAAVTVDAQAINGFVSDTIGDGNGNYSVGTYATFWANGTCVVYTYLTNQSAQVSSSFKWLTKGTPGKVDLRINSGTGDPMGLNLNQRYVLNIDRTVTITISGSDPLSDQSNANTFTYQLLSNATGTVLATSPSCTLQADIGI